MRMQIGNTRGNSENARGNPANARGIAEAARHLDVRARREARISAANLRCEDFSFATWTKGFEEQHRCIRHLLVPKLHLGTHLSSKLCFATPTLCAPATPFTNRMPRSSPLARSSNGRRCCAAMTGDKGAVQLRGAVRSKVQVGNEEKASACRLERVGSCRVDLWFAAIRRGRFGSRRTRDFQSTSLAEIELAELCHSLLCERDQGRERGGA
jgi:hypothetical protein